MLLDHLRWIHPVDVIRTEHANVFRLFILDQIEVLIDGVRRTLEPSFPKTHLRRNAHHIIVEERRHAPRHRNVAIETVTLVLCEHSDTPYAPVYEIAESEINEAIIAPKGNSRLGAISREGMQSFALAASQHNPQHICSKRHQV